MIEIPNKALFLIVLTLIIGSVVFLERRKPDRSNERAVDVEVMDATEKAERYEVSKEITTPDGFINTDRISIGEFTGKKVVLVDFWTYSCINCQRTLPHLNEWHEKYGDKGLVILGIHTPEFEFEEEYENVLRAVERFEVKYPVILDNDFSTWRAYRNRFWPRKYLVDIDGYIVYDHIGEGAYEETEEKIIELLEERSRVLGEDFEAEEVGDTQAVDVDFSRIKTPEIYFGSSRVEHLSNLPSGNCFGTTCLFAKPDIIPANTFALSGNWFIEDEFARLESASGSIFLDFEASKVNIVAGSEEEIEVEVYLDGEFVKNISIQSEDLYNLADLEGKYERHLLEVRFKDAGAEVFTFTFG